MNLKRIELYGFKSFADKTVISFEEPITGIVGPNGCGKSNIVDAVRWVLGEQSATNLRCKKMSEVIFNGTDNRRSLSYCEVSLVLDNSDRKYRVNFDELVITRKLYRGGESEYLINKTLARQRDILDIFRDSGIGKEGYSIIGQGKIDEIISTKPEARRQIFEDAAGITRHKVKRKETELKLIRTRENMSRLNDIVSEIERSLGPLQSEANTAATGRKLKNQLKMTEVSYFLYQCEHSAEERAKVATRLEKAKKDYDERERERDILSREYTIAMMDSENSDNMIRLKDKELSDLMVAAAEKRGDSKMLAGKLESLTVDLSNTERDIVQYEGRLQDREAQNTSLDVEYSELENTLATQNTEYAALQGTYDELSAAIDRQEREIAKSSELLSQKKDAVSEVKQSLVASEVERDMLQENIAKNKADLSDKSKELVNCQKDEAEYIAKLKTLNDERAKKQKELAASDKNLTACEGDLKNVELRSRNNEMRINQLKYQIEDAEEKKRDFSGYAEVVKRLLQDASRDRNIGSLVIGTVAQKLNVPKDIQLALEVSLGGALQNVIVETREDATVLIKYIRDKNYGRATFLPIEAVRGTPLPYDAQRILDEDGVIGVASELVSYDKRFSGIVSNLMGRLIVIEDNDTGIRLSRKYGNAYRMVTLDGTVFAPGGGMTGGSKPGKASQLFSRETELDELNKKLKQAEKEQAILKKDQQDLQQERSELSKASGVIAARIHQLDVEIEAVNIKLATAKKNIEYYQSEIDRLSTSIKDDGNKIVELERKINLDRTASASLSSEGSSTDDFLADAKQQLMSDKIKRDGMNIKLREAGAALAKAQNEFENIKKSIIANKADIKFISDSLITLRSNKTLKSQEAEEVRKKLDAITFDRADQDRIDAVKAQIAEMENLRDVTRKHITDLDEKRANANKLLAELTEKKVREENLMERLESEIDTLATRIREDYNLDYDTAKLYCEGINDPDFVFDPNKAGAESSALRRRIERLGPLNELAESRYEEEKARYDDNRAQYNDLVAAEADLENIINDLVSEMTSKFTESFNAINVNFQEIFQELFGGGVAKLELDQGTNGETNVLEAGIEITAAPPGKKPVRISLLSGGEKALTAIAILFAIIKLRPMPFSILDEIEAALDESNTTLYAQYVRKFSKQTQFIIITHRKPTMILADVLYGVMQQKELGVSEIVSVRLEEALKVVKEDEERAAKEQQEKYEQ